LAAIEAENPDDGDGHPHTASQGRGHSKLRRSFAATVQIGVIVLNSYTDRITLALLELGSERRGFILKERVRPGAASCASRPSPRRLGDRRSVVDVLVAARSRGATSPLAELTPRELEILGEMLRKQQRHWHVSRAHRGRREAHELDLLKLGLSNARTSASA
jgi:hypothetical protein